MEKMIQLQDSHECIISTEGIVDCWKTDGSGEDMALHVCYRGGYNDRTFNYGYNHKALWQDYDTIKRLVLGRTNIEVTPVNVKKESKMMDSVKKFYEKNQDVIFTIGAVLLVDYFLFNGALRTRVQTLIEKLLSSVEKKFEAKET